MYKLSLISLKSIFRKEIKIILDQSDPAIFTGSDYNFNHIPLTLRLQRNKLNYRSAIALCLAGEQLNRASSIAQKIVLELQNKIDTDFAEVRSVTPAWIEFTLTEHAIQHWLEDNFNHIRLLAVSGSAPEKIQSFPQYVRDRCWQLLNLGIRENLISLLDSTQQGQSIPWFDHNFLRDEDWQFLYQLISIIDCFDEGASFQQREKLAYRLSTAFLEFHRRCQLFDRQQPHFYQITGIRFSAILITERLLFQLGY
jgi:hypothetical protein